MAKNMPDYAGLRDYRRSRQTGTMVGLYNAEEAGLDTEGDQNWYCICEDHGTLLSHQTRTVAASFLGFPLEWCDACRAAQK